MKKILFALKLIICAISCVQCADDERPSLAPTSNINLSTHENETIVETSSALNLDEFCWTNNKTCYIVGILRPFAVHVHFPVSIDCATTVSVNENGNQLSNEVKRKRFLEENLAHRFKDIETIELNGCNANGNQFAVEFVTNPAMTQHLTLEMFRFQKTFPIDEIFNLFTHLHSLTLRNNRIEIFSGDYFGGLTELRELNLIENAIKSIDLNAFAETAKTLNLLKIVESELNLAQIADFPYVKQLNLSLSRLNWTALHSFEHSLVSLVLHNTQHIAFNETDTKQTFHALTELTAIKCRLRKFPVDHFPHLIMLNVSNNELMNVSLKQMQVTNLRVLDISFNHFEVLDRRFLEHVMHLEIFNAAHNKIRAINPKAFQRNHYLKFVDIRFNQLKELNLDTAIFHLAIQLKFAIDDNPWDCAWVNKIYGHDPHVFAMKYIYTNYAHRFNIRGLKCLPFDENSYLYHSHLHDEDDHYHLTGERRPRPVAPVEIIRRNPKHTAVLTIFILATGVSLLLVILYFFVKYRAVAISEVPLYQSLSQPIKQCDNKQCMQSIHKQNADERRAQFQLAGVDLSPQAIQSIDIGDDFHDIEFRDLHSDMTNAKRASVDTIIY